ncbi:kinase-like domain-containing protein [Xylariaceae sp. FL1272]|nr:kinase-like domain-containing protein [Xylariaceae sp. FL1272]
MMESMRAALRRIRGHVERLAKNTPQGAGPADTQSVDDPGFPRPYTDPRSTDDSYPFPLDGQDTSTVAEAQLFKAYSMAPRLHEYGGIKITRASKSLAIKGGLGVSKSEAENMKFAAEVLGLPVPKVHRTFTANIPNMHGSRETTGYFIVMDYIAGSTVETCWDSLATSDRESVAQQVSNAIEKMQAHRIDHLPIGPLGRGSTQKFIGPWFWDYGAGPFETLQELEDWFNHKVDVCVQVKQLPSTAPRFHFKDVVFTHQDIAPRNMILDEHKKVWLIDWGCAGIYPRGFEQVSLRSQSWNDEFVTLVLQRLSDQHEQLAEQRAGIEYGLSIGRHL